MDTPKFREAMEAAQGLDLSLQKDRVEQEGKVETVERAILEYRRFLVLAIVYPEQPLIPQTMETDEVWHAHILYTQQYVDDCDQLFGEFLHHQPGVGDMPQDLYEETIRIYQRVFQEMPQGTLWADVA